MKKQRINYKKERIILSDMLPYEVPPFFNNQELYLFLVKNKIKIIGSKLCFSKRSRPIVSVIMRILFGLDASIQEIKENPKYNYFKLKDAVFITIPYKYKIQHRNKFRVLSIIHPINQIAFIPFYHKYSSSIIYACNQSHFSIRKPCKIATIKYFKDLTNEKRRVNNSVVEIIETTDKEYTSLKTFFSYKEFSNIYKFYDSFEFHKSEKKFDFLMKFDISRCFDSVYTHSISWALANKSLIKENLTRDKTSLGAKFDSLMQKMNYNETNGIVIGPEFSRIFAELILQSIDRDIELSVENTYQLRNKIDYAVYRYVDDYFLFYNEENVREILFGLFNDRLLEYKFSLNDSKTKVYEKPIITNITIAKECLKDILSKTYFFYLNSEEITGNKEYHIFSANNLITKYKAIIRQTGITYGDIQNYFLAAILKKTVQQIRAIQKQQQKLIVINFKCIHAQVNNIETGEEIKSLITSLSRQREQFLKNMVNIIELVLFIYSVQPSVSYSIKVSNIFLRIISFFKNQESSQKRYVTKKIQNEDYFAEDIANLFGYSFDEKHQLYKQIFDGIVIIFNKKKDYELGQDGKWYLLSTLKELGKHYSLTESLIVSLVNLEICEWGYFNIIATLGYIEDNEKYTKLRKEIISHVLTISKKYDRKKTEHVLLIIDMLSCPFFYVNKTQPNQEKLKLLRNINIYPKTKSNKEILKDIKALIKYNNGYFYQWKNRSFVMDLNTKKGHFVY